LCNAAINKASSSSVKRNNTSCDNPDIVNLLWYGGDRECCWYVAWQSECRRWQLWLMNRILPGFRCA